MKKVLLTIISVCLIAASIFGLFAGVTSISDIMNVKEYKEKDAEEGLESIDTLDAGLDQLQENEGTYLAGVDTYTAGLVSYSEGKSTLSAGYAAYYAGKKQLEEGKAAYAAGKKQIEDNTAAYNEGKATLAKIEPLMPYVDQYVKFRNGTISNLAGFASAQAWFVSVVRLYIFLFIRTAGPCIPVRVFLMKPAVRQPGVQISTCRCCRAQVMRDCTDYMMV